MTTLFLTEKKCFVCGVTNRYPLIDLTFKITGTRDLDGRPSSIQRSLVYMWIQRCTACNYCAPDISHGDAGDAELIKDAEYISILNDSSYPDTARVFLCYSFSMKKKNLFADAGWANLCAAWICDDNGFEERSIGCRKNAIVLFQKAWELGQEFGDSRIEETIYLIDILRRTSQFDEALSICNEEITKDHPDHIMDLLNYEYYLIGKKDIACHDENDAEEFEY